MRPRTDAQHGVWIEYESGKIWQVRPNGYSIMDAAMTRLRLFKLLKAMKDRGAIISAKKVGISGGPHEWK